MEATEFFLFLFFRRHVVTPRALAPQHELECSHLSPACTTSRHYTRASHMPTSTAEKAALVETIRLRERELEAERKTLGLLREAFSYEVKMAMRDQHQLRGSGASSQQEAKLVSRNRKPNGGFFIGIDGQGASCCGIERVNCW